MTLINGQSPLSDATAVKAKPNSKEAETSHAFETVFLSQFVDQMMKTVDQAAFGNEKTAEMWRSFMSDAVAKQLVEQGGLGLSGQVKDMLDAYSISTETEGE